MTTQNYGNAGELVSLARFVLQGEGSISRSLILAERQAPHLSRVVSVLRTAVTAGSTLTPAWAGNLADYRQISAGFVEALRNLSVFDRLFADMRRVPLRTRLGIVAVGATAYDVGEGAPTPVSRLSLTDGQLDARKAVAIIVVSQELLKLDRTAVADTTLSRELRVAVAAETNAQFLAGVTAGAASVASAGSTAANILADVEALLDRVHPTAVSRLYLVVDGATAGKLATKANADGSQAFPGMTPQGGDLAGIPVLVADDSDGDTAGSRMVLIDAAAIAADSDVVMVDVSTEATLQMDSQPSAGAQNQVSLFQTNSAALKATRWYGYELLRADGVAVATGVNY
jgi:hypothetical protein